MIRHHNERRNVERIIRKKEERKETRKEAWKQRRDEGQKQMSPNEARHAGTRLQFITWKEQAMRIKSYMPELVPVAHICHPSCSVGRDQED
jgi:hypothetical protein